VARRALRAAAGRCARCLAACPCARRRIHPASVPPLRYRDAASRLDWGDAAKPVCSSGSSAFATSSVSRSEARLGSAQSDCLWWLRGSRRKRSSVWLHGRERGSERGHVVVPPLSLAFCLQLLCPRPCSWSWTGCSSCLTCFPALLISCQILRLSCVD